jgi:predicted HTH domain antitoxin
MTDMGLLYDITKDYLYQEGLTKGIEKGKKELIISLLEDKAFSIEKIARLAKVSADYVEAIAKELRK